jgi:hypothetical protein
MGNTIDWSLIDEKSVQTLTPITNVVKPFFFVADSPGK